MYFTTLFFIYACTLFSLCIAKNEQRVERAYEADIKLFLYVSNKTLKDIYTEI